MRDRALSAAASTHSLSGHAPRVAMSGHVRTGSEPVPHSHRQRLVLPVLGSPVLQGRAPPGGAFHMAADLPYGISGALSPMVQVSTPLARADIRASPTAGRYSPIMRQQAARPPAASYDYSMMGTATLGPWRRRVSEFQVMSMELELSDSAESDANSTAESDEAVEDKQIDEEGETTDSSTENVLQRWSPDLYAWVSYRMGTRQKTILILVFVFLEVCKTFCENRAYVTGINYFSVLVFTNFTSLLMALWVSFLVEGGNVMGKLLRWHPVVRFMGISFLFTFASSMVLFAIRIGTSHVEVVTVGYIYMPIAVVLSYYVFRRRYGMLEWLSVGMMSLSILVFVLLREESRPGDHRNKNGPRITSPGVLIVFFAVCISVSASILAERALKEQPWMCTAMRAKGRKQRQTPFYVLKVPLDLCALVIAVCLWIARTVLPSFYSSFFEKWSMSNDWFGKWGADQFILVPVAAAHGWSAGMVTREFSTVIKAIVQTLSVVGLMLIEDPMEGNRFHFQSRGVPSFLLGIILLMSALIFQTGRINLKVLRKAANLDTEAYPELNMDALPEPENRARLKSISGSPAGAKRTSFADESRGGDMDDGGANRSPSSQAQLLSRSSRTGASFDSQDPQPAEKSTSCESQDQLRRRLGSQPELRRAGSKGRNGAAREQQRPLLQSWRMLFTTYALILVYIVSDAGRTIVLQKSLQTTVINSTSMGLVCYICGAIVASCMSLYTHGWRDGFLRAWHPGKILHCLPAAFLFALATALANMSFTQGINSALYVVLGKFYTPVAALAARWILGKYYMWLEWFALMILTLASVVFGYLQAAGGANAAPVSAMVLVLASAATSAMASLVTEKILKEETVPFHLQKVRLDVGSIISSIVLLPLLGMISTQAQDIPWAGRPWDKNSCPADSVCWDITQQGCQNDGCGCECTSGVFAGWNNPVLLLAVFINTSQGWLVGRVTQQFSVIHRAIADSFSLLAIYFICDPIFNGTRLDNLAQNLVAFIVPLSTATFAVATSEMQKVFNATVRLKRMQRRALSGVLDSGSDESDDLSDVSPGLSGGARTFSDQSPNSHLQELSPGSDVSPLGTASPSPMRREFRSVTDGAWTG